MGFLEDEPANVPTCVKASDDKGHNVGISTRVPSEWVRHIDTLMKDRDLPYFNRGDLIRDAVFKHLKFLSDWGDEQHHSAYYSISALVRSQLADKTHEEFEKLMGIVEKNVTAYLELGDKDQAKRYVTKIVHLIERMPNTYWKDVYYIRLHKKYPGLLGLVSCAKW